MSTPVNTPSITTINGQGDAPVEDQHFKRWMLTMAEAFIAGASGGSVIGATYDAGPSWTTVRGVSGLPVSSADMTSAANVTDAPTTGQKIVIDDLLISVGGTALSLTFTEETSGTVIRGPLYFAANSTQQITLRGKTKLPVANKKLKCTASAAGNVTIEASYHSEA